MLFAAAALHAQQIVSPFDLNIEELGQLRVTTASRRGESLNAVAASIYVITAEDIRRSGVRSIPEALRLAPGVEVARNGSNEWTISIRGFSSDLSNKLLVLINGRSVYSPLFAGVFWDVQDTLLEDIERIEVVSGPGGAVWGANAVNGVINIITHSASDTQGTLAQAGGGNEEEAWGALRHGWQINDNMWARAYVKHFERGASRLASGGSAFDDWDMSRAGFALEWETPEDQFNLRLEAYSGEESALLRSPFTVGTLPGPDFPGEVGLAGRSVNFVWRHTISAESNWRVQAYYDYTDRQIPYSFNEARDTYDIALLHDLRNFGRHDVQWGIEARSTEDRIGNSLFATFTPDSRSDQRLSAFIQNRIELQDERLFLTLGSKLEHNDYTGGETQPSIQVTWLPGRHTVWGSFSRAVRVPARLNTDLELFAPITSIGGLPLYVAVNGSDDYLSEKVEAYEAGYRVQVGDRLSLDMAVFDNQYDRLQTQEAGPFTAVPGPPAYFVIPVRLGNLMEGETYGGTVAVNWQPLETWRLQLHYAHLQMDLSIKPGSTDVNAPNLAGNSPEQQAGVTSFVELPVGLSLYTAVRYVAELPNQAVPSYTSVDLSLGWEPSDQLRAALTVHNLNDAERREFGENRLIERSAHVALTWRF